MGVCLGGRPGSKAVEDYRSRGRFAYAGVWRDASQRLLRSLRDIELHADHRTAQYLRSPLCSLCPLW